MGLTTAVITPENGHCGKPNPVTIQRSGIRYLLTQHTLVLNNPGQGEFILIDLAGNVVSRKQVSSLEAKGNVSIALPVSISTGLYVARYAGVHGAGQMKITVLK